MQKTERVSAQTGNLFFMIAFLWKTAGILFLSAGILLFERRIFLIGYWFCLLLFIHQIKMFLFKKRFQRFRIFSNAVLHLMT